MSSPTSQIQTDLDKIDSRGKSALYHAVEAGDSNKVKQLLKAGANANIGYSYYRQGPRFETITPLYLAVKQGNDKIADLLIQFGADINRGHWSYNGKEIKLQPPLAVATGECIKLLKSLSANATTQKPRLKHGFLLFDQIADLYSDSQLQNTPLVNALKQGDKVAVQTYIDMNYRNVADMRNNGQLARFQQYIDEEQFDLAHEFYQLKGLVDEKDNCGRAPLIEALSRLDHPRIIRLLQLGADITVTNLEGETASQVLLTDFFEHGYPTLPRVMRNSAAAAILTPAILSFHSLEELISQLELTSFEDASKTKSKHVRTLLKGMIPHLESAEHEAVLQQALERAIESGEQDNVKFFIQNGVIPSYESFITLITASNYYKYSYKILEKPWVKAYLDQSDSKGQSALIRCVQAKRLPKFIDSLIAKGAKVDSPDNQGQTAVSIARQLYSASVQRSTGLAATDTLSQRTQRRLQTLQTLQKQQTKERKQQVCAELPEQVAAIKAKRASFFASDVSLPQDAELKLDVTPAGIV